jgi:hypothetical protein
MTEDKQITDRSRFRSPMATTDATRNSGVISVVDRKRFFAGIVKHCRAKLPVELANFHHSGTFNLMKVWYDYGRIHFEVVIDQQIQRIEIGLHFEDGPASTIAYLNVLDARIVELKALLGFDVELERWTQSWGRIYVLLPLVPLTPDVISECAERLTQFIETLWPIIDESGVVHIRDDESR